MGPLALIGTIASAASTLLGAYGSMQAMQQQAAAQQYQAANQEYMAQIQRQQAIERANIERQQAEAARQRAEIEARWAKRKKAEELARAQTEARNRLREMRLARSRLMAEAAASGAGTDGTVSDLFDRIVAQGRINAGYASASGLQRASAIDFQSALNTWAANTNFDIANAAIDSNLRYADSLYNSAMTSASFTRWYSGRTYGASGLTLLGNVIGAGSRIFGGLYNSGLSPFSIRYGSSRRYRSSFFG